MTGSVLVELVSNEVEVVLKTGCVCVGDIASIQRTAKIREDN